MNANEVLCDIPIRMAKDINPIYQGSSMQRYQRFLNCMYHYTLYSEGELKHAANLAPDETLKDFFNHMTQEEAHHYRLAENDLIACDGNISENSPEAVEIIHRAWMSIEPGNYFQFLGALYALENVAQHSLEQTIACLTELQLKPNQSRFISVHIKADEAHGTEIAALCEKYMPNHGDDILKGATEIGALWSHMHLAII